MLCKKNVFFRKKICLCWALDATQLKKIIVINMPMIWWKFSDYVEDQISEDTPLGFSKLFSREERSGAFEAA